MSDKIKQGLLEKYNPVSSIGVDDAADLAISGANQIYKKLTATIKNPVALNLKALGAGALAGIVTESTTQNFLDATRGGRPNTNPYLANLERLGSRVVGGATSGLVYSKNPAGAVVGAIGGAGVDAAQNLMGIASFVPEAVALVQGAFEAKRNNERLRAIEQNQFLRFAKQEQRKLKPNE
jgi:hypothetical protein